MSVAQFGSTRSVNAGVAAGIAVALWASKWVEPMLFDVSAKDPAIFVLVGGLLLFAVSGARAAETTWTRPPTSPGFWDETTNWSAGRPTPTIGRTCARCARPMKFIGSTRLRADIR